MINISDLHLKMLREDSSKDLGIGLNDDPAFVVYTRPYPAAALLD